MIRTEHQKLFLIRCWDSTCRPGYLTSVKFFDAPERLDTAGMGPADGARMREPGAPGSATLALLAAGLARLANELVS